MVKELFERVKPGHVFAALLQQLGSRRLDVSDDAGLQEVFQLLAAQNPVFMAGFVFMHGRCTTIPALLQQFCHEGVIRDIGMGIYEISQGKLRQKLLDTKIFKKHDFRGLDALVKFSLPPAEKPSASEILAAQAQ